ncbi:MAG: thiopeptide-type bacteriocin biosynthesis protein, partial [bacterium]|nr:thiopeptide-type bacteriocin biosynthesis protein [bacterium]
GRRVRPAPINTWNHASLASGAGRFLAFIGEDGMQPPSGLSWGTRARLPFLPRLRAGRLVLSLARWLMPRRILDGTAEEVLGRLQQWRAEWRVPRYVYYAHHAALDQRLLLDLEAPAGIELLRDQASDRVEVLRLEEVYPSFEETWLRREGEPHLCEFVASLVRPLRGVAKTPAPPRLVRREARLRAFDSEWLYVKLYCGFGRQTLLLDGPVRTLLDELRAQGTAPRRWFFLRYADPQPHLRLRLQLAAQGQARQRDRLVEAFECWMREGAIDRYVLDTYHREIERYGGERAMDVVEELFTGSSALALEGLSEPSPRGAEGDPYRLDVRCIDPEEPQARRGRMRQCLTTMDDIIRELFPGDNLARWLQATRPPKRDPANQEQRQDIRSVREAIIRRRASQGPSPLVVGPIKRLRQLAAEGALERPLYAIAHSLIHMHCNRFGLSTKTEGTARRLQWSVYFSLSRMATAPKSSSA